jgi:uncharacterized hydrophobic protein (TIGR00271 family)
MLSQPDDDRLQPSRFQQWLRLDPEHKPRICSQIYDSAEFTSLNYWLDIVFSAGIATFGLVLNSPAVIIGAMLISPLMGPIMATGLSLAVGDLYLSIKAVGNLLASIALAIALSSFFVWLLPFHSATAEILGRTNPNLLDLGIALFSGLAGSVAVSRAGGAGGVTTLPGVAIAVALMPPLCAMGFGLGSGADMRIMGGAGLLFLTNLVAIVASAFAVFLLIGMNSPEIRAQMERSRKGERFAEMLSRSPLSQALLNGGQLRWRVLILVVLLGAIAVPLRTALLQVAGEAVARGAVQQVLKGLLPRSALVSQQVEVGRGTVLVRLVSTEDVPDSSLRNAEAQIQRRSGRKTDITVARIASQSELEELIQRLAASAPPTPEPAPSEKSLAQIRAELMARLTPVLTAIWPAQAPLKNFDLAFALNGTVLNVHYQSAKALDPIALDIITKELREKLKDPSLSMNAALESGGSSAKRDGIRQGRLGTPSKER